MLHTVIGFVIIVIGFLIKTYFSLDLNRRFPVLLLLSDEFQIQCKVLKVGFFFFHSDVHACFAVIG